MARRFVSEIKFGTDGWRGVIADNFTFKNVSIVAQAISDWVKKDCRAIKGRKIVTVGYDTRFLSEEYAQIVSCVLTCNNILVYLSDDMIPTQSLSYGTVYNKAVAGVMITASHNPAQFNGIKIKTSQGGVATNDITNRIERYVGKNSVKSMLLSEAN